MEAVTKAFKTYSWLGTEYQACLKIYEEDGSHISNNTSVPNSELARRDADSYYLCYPLTQLHTKTPKV